MRSSKDLPPFQIRSHSKNEPLFEASSEPEGLLRSVNMVRSRPTNPITDSEASASPETDMESAKAPTGKETAFGMTGGRIDKDTSRVETLSAAITLDENGAGHPVNPLCCNRTRQKRTNRRVPPSSSTKSNAKYAIKLAAVWKMYSRHLIVLRQAAKWTRMTFYLFLTRKMKRPGQHQTIHWSPLSRRRIFRTSYLMCWSTLKYPRPGQVDGKGGHK